MSTRNTRCRALAASLLATIALLAPAGDVRAQPAPSAEGGPVASSVERERPDPLRLDEVLEGLDRALPLLEAARRERDVAEADVLSAQGGFDPALRLRGGVVAGGYYQYGRVDTTVEVPTPLWGTTFFAGWRLGVGSIPSYYGNLETNSYGELRAGAQVPLWRNGPTDRRRANIARAELGLPITSLGVEQQRIELSRAATLRYWEWVASGLRVAVARRLLDAARARDAGLASRAARGDLPAIERAENLRAVAQREGNLVAAERALAQAAIELSLFLRGPDGAPRLPDRARLPASMPEPDAADPSVDEAMRTALERRPEPRRLAAQREQLRVERDWARNQAAPAIDLVVTGSQDLGPGSNTRSRPELDAALVVEVPLLTRAATGRVRAADAGIARVDAQQRFARERIEADVRDAHSALDAAARRLAAVRAEVSVAHELERLERARFALGEGTLLFVNLREQAAAEADVREVDALAEYQRARASWRAALALDGRAPQQSRARP